MRLLTTSQVLYQPVAAHRAVLPLLQKALELASLEDAKKLVLACPAVSVMRWALPGRLTPLKCLAGKFLQPMLSPKLVVACPAVSRDQNAAANSKACH